MQNQPIRTDRNGVTVGDTVYVDQHFLAFPDRGVIVEFSEDGQARVELPGEKVYIALHRLTKAD